MTRFLKVFLAALLTLGLLFVALPALLLLGDVPPFRIGDGLLFLVEWRNDPQGTGITFGILPLGVLAFAIALIDQGMVNRDRR
jgi:triphosphoribosyl-dephospho-CoA synthetase